MAVRFAVVAALERQRVAGPKRRKADSVLLGLACMVGAMACFPIMQTCVKLVVTDHGLSFMQATWGRYFFHFLVVPLFFPSVFKSLSGATKIGVQVTRGMLLFLGTCAAFLALRYLPLPQVTALGFAAPVMVTVLAALVLRERVGWRRWEIGRAHV